MALLGQLTVGILGDLSGYSDTLSKAQKETLRFSKNLEKTGKNISTIGYGFQDLGSKLTKMITLPALAAGTAVAGITLKKGWDRLMGIDTAQAKLKALGHDAKSVDSIMESALTSVKGTAFGLGEAATTAANAVAAGVKPGEELTRYLTLAGDAAAVAGADLSEMGSILNKVQTSNKAYNLELQQLSDRGLPIYQWLADEANTTADAIFDMASSGEISSEMLLEAIEKNIGGAAGIMGAESFAAGMENVWAAVGRLGAAFLDAGGEAGGFFSSVKPLMADLIEYFDSLGDVAADLGVKFGEAFNSMIAKVREIKQWYDDLSPTMQNLIQKVALFGSIGAVAIGPFLLIIGKVIVGVGNLISRIGVITAAVTKLGGVFGILTGPIGITVGIIASLIAVGVLLVKNWDTVKEKAHSVFSIFGPLLDTVKQSFSGLLDSVGPTTDNLKNLWQSLLPILEKVGLVVGAVLVGAFGILVSVLNGVLQAIAPITNALISFVDFVVNMVNVIVALLTEDFAGAWQYWQDAGQSAIDFFVNMINGILDLLIGFVDGVIDFFYGLYMTLVGNSIIPDMVNEIIEWFVNLFSSLIEIVTNIVDGVIAFFTTLYERAVQIFEAFSQFIVDVWNYIKQTFSNVLAFLLALVTGDFEGMKNAMQNQMQNAQQLLSNIWSLIKTLIGQKASEILSDVTSKFIEIKNNIQNKIGEAKDGAIRRFSEMKSNVTSKASEIVGNVKTKFNEAKDAIIEPITIAKNKVGEIVDDIKSFFSNMKLKIPKIELPKMPKFSLSGKFSLKPPSVPKIGVNWNAQGGIFKKPTIFNTANAGLQGVGEAGAEAIIPLKSNVLGLIGDAIAKNMSKEETETSTVIHVENMNVRDEYDIQRIAKELDDLANKRGRQKGVVRTR